MAYIEKEEVKEIRKKLKKEFPEIKFSVTMEHYSSVKASILKSPYDFSSILGDSDNIGINEYYPEKYGEFEAMFTKMINILKGDNWFNDSDTMRDYSSIKHYLNLSIGKFDRPYEQIQEKKAS